jgi:molecular chaperone GrpE (heat shock protein)
MTTEQERIAQLEAELATLQASVRELLAENAALKRRLAQDSQNSSTPPASDG